MRSPHRHDGDQHSEGWRVQEFAPSVPAPFCVLVIAKAPVAGRAKTRLCPPATPEESAEIAAASLLDTLGAVLATPGAVPVIALTGELTTAARAEEISDILSGQTVIGQGAGGLAVRLARTMAHTARLHPGLPVLLLGMDTPQVCPALLTSVAAQLTSGNAEALLGPAADGGWWLLGMRQPGDDAALRGLRQTPMSRPDTGELTLRALRSAGLQAETVTTLSDVDSMADADDVAELVPGTRFSRAVAAVTQAAS